MNMPVNSDQHLLGVDTSEVDELLSRVGQRLSPEQFERLMRRTLNEVGQRSKKPIADASLREYEGKSTWIKADIKSAQITGSGFQLDCVIPLIGSRWTIGGNHLKAKGGVPGWASMAYAGKGRRYKITTQILRGISSTLPEEMEHMGGNPPFINTAAPKLHGAVFTRVGGKTKTGKDKIAAVTALAMPQMPLNRASDETENAIIDLLRRRVEHNFQHMFDGI